VAGSAPIDALDVVRNRMTRAHTGVWLEDLEEAVVERNRTRRCGAEVNDVFFGDTGCAVRVGLPEAWRGGVRILRNDLRGLDSPADDPAVRISPATDSAACFPPNHGNRVGAGRPLHPLDVN
jgi:hypothetical protein